MSSNYSDSNTGGHNWIEIYSLDTIESISEPDSSNSVVVQLAPLVSRQRLLVTKDTIEPNIIKKDDIWEVSVKYKIPKINLTSSNVIKQYCDKPCIVVYQDKNNNTILLGSLDMPVFVTEIQRQEPAEPKNNNCYNISVYGYSLDEPFLCSVSDI